MSELPAGRELDALVAERVFGAKLHTLCDTFKSGYCDGVKRTRCMACGAQGHANCYGHGDRPLQCACEVNCDAPSYSQDIAAAWEVVDRMEADGWHWCIRRIAPYWSDSDHGKHVEFWHYTDGRLDSSASREGNTAAHAICLAALAAQGNPTRDPEAPSEEGHRGSRHAAE